MQNVWQRKDKIVLKQNWSKERNVADGTHRNLAKLELCSDLLLPGALRVKAAVGQYLKTISIAKCNLAESIQAAGFATCEKALAVHGGLASRR